MQSILETFGIYGPYPIHGEGDGAIEDGGVQAVRLLHHGPRAEVPGANVIKLFHSLLMRGHTKLESLFLTRFSRA